MESLFIRTSRFTGKDHPENTRTPIDIAYSLSILREQGHKAKVLDMKADKLRISEVERIMRKKSPEVVFLKTQTPCVDISERLAGVARKNGVEKIFFFGQHPTVSPETFQDNEDCYIIRGEIEPVLNEIINEKGFSEEISGVEGISECEQDFDTRIVKAEDMDSLPLPAHEDFVGEKYGDVLPIRMDRRKTVYGYMETSRGCPFNCMYCSPTLRISYGKKMRYRSPKKVVDEIEKLKGLGVNVIVFKDDIFTVSEGHVEQICDEIIKRDLDISWVAQTRADSVSQSLLKRMKEAGCKTLCIGVESGSSRILEILKKGENKHQIREAFENAKKAGLDTVGYFMLGNPTETREEMEKTLDFCLELEPDMVQVAFFTPYPGSEAYDMYEEKMDEEFSGFHHYNNLTFNPSKVSDKELVKFQKRFYLRYFMSKGFLKGLLKRKMENPLDFTLEKSYLRKGIKFLFH